MKKYLSIIIVFSAFLVVHCHNVSAQSDKKIFQSSEDKLLEKDCKSAFELVITAKNTKVDRAQAILKKAFPCLISENFKQTSKIKLTDTSNTELMCENLRNIITILKDNEIADSLFKLNVPEAIYRSFSKEKRNSKLLGTYKARLKEEESKINKAPKAQEKVQLPDSSQTAIIVAPHKEEVTPHKEEKVIKDTVSSQHTEIKNPPETKQITAVDTNKVEEDTESSDESSTKYYIIKGSYKTIMEAAKMVNKLKANGYAAEMVGQDEQGNYRVSLNSYNKKSDALRELQLIQKFQKDAWILEK